jgi:hypothetical protein
MAQNLLGPSPDCLGLAIVARDELARSLSLNSALFPFAEWRNRQEPSPAPLKIFFCWRRSGAGDGRSSRVTADVTAPVLGRFLPSSGLRFDTASTAEIDGFVTPGATRHH